MDHFSTKVLLGHFLFVNLCTEISNINTVGIRAVHSGFFFKMKWINTLLNSENVVMHLEALITMSLVFATTFFFLGGGTSSLGCPDRF